MRARAVVAAGWVAVAGMAVVALARFALWDRRVSIVATDGLAPLLVAPAWAVLAVAAVARRRALAVAAAVLALAHVLVVAPELAAREPVPAWAAGAPSLRVFDGNALVGGGDPAAYAAVIRRTRPDVVVLQESTAGFVAALQRAGLGRDYPWVEQVDRSDPFAMTVLSALPMDSVRVVQGNGRPMAVLASLDVDGRPLRLVAAHAVAGFGTNREAWQRDLSHIGRLARGDGPVVVAGDLNATWNHRAFRSLLATGLVDAAAARGRPFDATWPRDRRLVPPLMRIDHVLTGRGAAVTRVRTGDAAGSDHRWLVADVAVRP